jgi:hypothetical protein
VQIGHLGFEELQFLFWKWPLIRYRSSLGAWRRPCIHVLLTAYRFVADEEILNETLEHLGRQ